MTATLSPSGELVLPPEVYQAVQALPSRQFDVVVSTSGVIMLCPERKPKRTLVKSFAALRGLNLEHRKDPIPELPAL